MSSRSHQHLFFVLLAQAFFTLQNMLHPSYRKTAFCNYSAMLFIYKKTENKRKTQDVCIKYCTGYCKGILDLIIQP